MRRIASHYIYWQKWYRMYYLELDADNRLIGIFPLEQEIAHTEFVDGTLIPLPVETSFSPNVPFSDDWLKEADMVTVSSCVAVYHLPYVSPATTELGTNDSRRDCHIQRL